MFEFIYLFVDCVPYDQTCTVLYHLLHFTAIEKLVGVHNLYHTV